MMTRTISHWAVVLGLLVAGAGCGKPTPDGDQDMGKVGDTGLTPDERRRAMLSDIAEGVVLAAYEDFAASAAELNTSLDAWASSNSEEDRQAAIAAWEKAMRDWEVAEPYQFGPAGPMGTVAGGQDLRDQIYSWPTTNPCRVDQEIVEQNYQDAATFREEPVNVRGLDALEYLLHYQGTTNQCAPARGINADGSWDALSESELQSRRAAYAKTLGQDLKQSADELVSAWKDGFADELANAGEGSETYGSTREALNAVSDALFYIEKDVKDMKLAEPAGIVECTNDVCPGAREFQWSEQNFVAIDANVEGFQRAFTGGEGLGFEDLLRDAGQDQLADEMNTKIEEARTDVSEIDRPMVDLLTDDKAVVVEAHTRVKAITDLLKTQFVGVLDLELPQRAEGDND